jgi:hypothetical protein
MKTLYRTDRGRKSAVGWGVLLAVLLLAPVCLHQPADAQQPAGKKLVLPKNWTCPRCGTVNPLTTNNECKTCGFKVNLQIACPHCQKQVSIGPATCPHCGGALPQPPSAAQAKEGPGGSSGGGTTNAAWTCDRCGHRNPAGQATCQRCGATSPASAGSSPAPSAEQEKDVGELETLDVDRPADSADPAPRAKPRKELSHRDKQRIKKIERFYTDLFSQYLKSRDWFIRAVAIVGLGKLLTDETTELLIDILAEDRDGLVRVYAWEALHARNPELTDKQREAWVSQGVRTALMPDGFRGDLRVGLLRAMTPYGPDAFGGRAPKVVMKYLNETDHRNPKDHRTLKALRKLLAAWRDPDLTEKIARKMATAGIGNRVEYILGGLNGQIQSIGRADADHEVSTMQWRQKRAEWMDWLKETDLKSPEAGSLPAYTDRSPYLPAARAITDPDDLTWRKELELDKLKVNQFDLVFVVDSTSSMLPVMQWLARDLGKILSAMKRYAREPRIGVVYYRHEIHKPLMRPCCEAAGPGKKIRYVKRKGTRTGGPEMITVQAKPGEKVYEADNYRVKAYRLTGKIRLLAKAMAAEQAIGGHDNPPGSTVPSPGAVHGGLLTAIQKQPWTKSSLSRKIIVLVGDAPPTDGTLRHIQELLAKATEAGLRINVLKVALLGEYLSEDQLQRVPWSPAMKKLFQEFDQIAVWGNGQSVLGQFLGNPPPITGQIAPPPRGDNTYKQVIGQIIRSTLPEGYGERVDPLVEVLAEYTDAVPPKRRR